jgi:hypothetical protein
MARAVPGRADRRGFDAAEITRLRREIESAWGAFDDIEQMDFAHRVRVVHGLSDTLPDAASAAARAGLGDLALALLDDAVDFPPPWASICGRWDLTLEMARAAVESIAWPEGEPWGEVPLVETAA